MTSFGSFDNYQRAKADGYQVIPVALPVGGGSIWFNTTRPPFDDIRARRAIILGLNYEQADQTINGGAPETAPPRFMIRPPSPLHDPSVPLPAHDAREAQRLLNELNAEKGGPLEFSLSATPGHRYAEFFQSQLTQFDDVEVSVVPVPGADYIPTLAAGRFDAIMFGAAGFDPEPDWYDWYDTGATRNFRKYSNPRMDAALDTGRTSLDPQRRREAYRTVQQLVIEDALEAWYTPNAGGLDGGFILAKSVRDFAAMA